MPFKSSILHFKRQVSRCTHYDLLARGEMIIAATPDRAPAARDFLGVEDELPWLTRLAVRLRER